MYYELILISQSFLCDVMRNVFSKTFKPIIFIIIRGLLLLEDYLLFAYLNSSIMNANISVLILGPILILKFLIISTSSGFSKKFM